MRIQRDEDALDVLRDARSWRLTVERWAGVAEVLARLETAVRDGDHEAVRARVYELELSGPVRATGMEEEPTVDAPASVRPLLNGLVYAFEEDEPEPPPGDEG